MDIFLLNGKGVYENKTEASQYFKNGADNDGEGIPVNKVEASKYYKLAADNGSAKSIFLYAKMC